MIDFRNYEAMTFDCYGTLIDWESGILSALGPFRDKHGIDATDNDLLEAYARAESHVQRGFYRPYRDVLREVMKQIAVHYQVSSGEFNEQALVESLPSWKAFPDTVSSLGTLSKYFDLGIISNIDNDLFAETAKHLQMDFEWVFTAQHSGAYKPAHRMFRYAKDHMGVHPSQIIHTAQSRFHDIKPASMLDWTTVWVNRRGDQTHPGATTAVAAEATLTVPDLETLAEMVRQQIGAPVERMESGHFYI